MKARRVAVARFAIERAWACDCLQGAGVAAGTPGVACCGGEIDRER